MPGDRQAQAHAAIGTRQRRVTLVEPLPDACDLLVVHANTRVDDRDPNVALQLRVRADIYGHPAIVWREFQSVADVAAQHVDQLVLIGINAGRDASGNRQPQIDAFGVGLALEVFDDLADDPRQVDRPLIDALHA